MFTMDFWFALIYFFVGSVIFELCYSLIPLFLHERKLRKEGEKSGKADEK